MRNRIRLGWKSAAACLGLAGVVGMLAFSGTALGGKGKPPKDNTPGDQEIYVDGVNDTATRMHGSVSDNGSVFRLGWAESRDGGGYQEYVGLMDDVYLYDRSLAAAEVADLYDVLSSVIDPLPTTNLRVTADSRIYLETAANEATLGNLTLDSGVNLKVAGAAARFHNVTAGEGSSIEGDLLVAGTLSPGDSPGTLGEDAAGRTARDKAGSTAAASANCEPEA